jgi:hypothetical protein
MRRVAVLIAAAFIGKTPAFAQQNSARDFVFEFSGKIGVQSGYSQTLRMPRPIVQIVKVSMSGGYGAAKCEGEGTRDLVALFAPSGVVGVQFNSKVVCKVIY